MESEGKREETIRWKRKVPGFGAETEKGCLRKNPLPIHKFLSNFHLLSLHGFRVFSFSLVVQLVSVQLSRHLELMRQLDCLRGEVL